ncbi:MAG: hypothetical protein EOP10_16570 [Proteobacteria bacterium]|nr:MAG: hypothetical protein EOP10_16570 [Pseudomonadota bacterium]
MVHITFQPTKSDWTDMKRLLALLLLTACAYDGPRVEDITPPNLEAKLLQSVDDPKIAGITNLIVFGDSLSDPGNLSSNTFHFVLPHEIFYKGRFSNGPIWADYVRAASGWKVDNFAVGGAQTHTAVFPERLVIKSFEEQIEASKSTLKDLNPDATLIAIWIGPNDYLRNGSEYEDHKEPNVKVLESGVKRSLSEIRKSILNLRKLGFKKIALGTMPELGGINRNPQDQGYTASDKTLFMATRLHNDGIYTIISEFKKNSPDLKIYAYRAYDINKATYENPKAYAFTRLDTPCFQGSLSGEFYGPKEFCEDPMGYKFWEYLHPNTRMHCFYATQFLTDASEAGLIAGFHKDKTLETCKSL